MKSTFVYTRLALLLAMLLAPLSFVASAHAGYDDIQGTGELVATVAVPSGFSSAEVQEAIVASLAGRQWGLKAREEGTVIGYLKHRSNEAKVTFKYDTSKVDLYCIGWQVHKKTGVREKPELPSGWLKNLQADLTKHFNRITTQK